LLTSSILYGLSQWAVLATVAKLGNSAMVGSFALGLAISAPVMLFCDLRLRSILASDARAEFPFWDYLTVRIGTSITGVLVITLAALWYDRRTCVLIVLIGIAKAFESLSDVTYGLLQRNDRMRRLALSQSFKGPLSVLSVGAGLYATANVIYAGFGLAFAWGALFLLFDFPYAWRLSASRAEPKPVRGNRKRLLLLVRTAAPLGLAAMIGSLSVNIPRYFLEASHGRSALGYFTAIFYASIVIGRIVTALSEALVPRLAQAYLTDRSVFAALFSRCLLLVAGLGFLGVGGSVLLGGRFLAALYRPEYARFEGLLTVVMVYGAVSGASTALTYALTATRRLTPQARIAALTMIVTLLASATLIPRYGIDGAAWVLCAAASVEVAVAGFVLTRAVAATPVLHAADAGSTA
jgi:O-antigen/teichoic acid export membrane protein